MMAKYRQVHTTFWNDSFVLDLTPEEKYFYLYLMTNDQTTQCGIYELPKRIIEMQTGYNRETVEKLLKRFEEYEKVKYNDSTKEVFMTNWAKYNWINSIKVITCIDKELKTVKFRPFVNQYIEVLQGYGYRIDTLSIDLGEEENKNKNKNNREQQPINAHEFYMNHIYFAMNDIVSQEITEYANRTSDELVIEAMKKMLLKPTKDFRYAKTILNNWEDKGIKTIEDMNKEEEAFQSNKKGKGNSHIIYPELDVKGLM